MGHEPIARRCREVLVLDDLGQLHLKRLHSLFGDAKHVGVHHHFAPHFHIGGQAFVKCAEIFEPVAQADALGMNLNRLAAATLHELRKHREHHHGRNERQEQREFVGYEKREDAHEAQQHCEHEENHTIVRTFFLEEVALVRFSRNHALPAFHSVVERLRVIGSELLNSAKPQGIGTLGNFLEYEVHRLFINRVDDLFFPARKARDVVIVHRFAAAHAKKPFAGRFVAAGIEANCADMGQMHERRRKIIGRFGIETPQSPDNCGRKTLCRHIAPVFILKLGLILAAMAEEHEHRPHDNADGGNQAHHNEEKRLQTGGIRLVRKLGFILEHGIEPIAHMLVGRRA